MMRNFWQVVFLSGAGLALGCTGGSGNAPRSQECTTGYSDCGGLCVDLTGDGQNCGACGTSCAADSVCSAGTCQSSCTEPGRTRCETSCVDVQSNPSHCGACGVVCASGQSCQGGTCIDGAGSGGTGAGGTGGSFSTEVVIEEGERGQCDADGVVESTNSGFTGAGYLNSDNSAGASIEWALNVGEAGTYALEISYANQGADRPADVLVGEAVAVPGVSFAPTASWSTWSTVTAEVTLVAGENRITLRAADAAGLANIDSLKVTGAAVAAFDCDGATGAGGTGGTGGGGTGGGGTGGTPSEFPFNPSFILGADISWTLEQESGGAVFKDGSTTKAIERIFVDHGFNYVRLRTFVCPDCPGGYADVPSYSGFSPTNEAWCDTAHTIEMAKRVKACGMGLFLDFHMSDLWASIGEQHVPSAWAGMNPSQMQAAAYDHVKGVLAQMIAAGVKPDMVQVGNENNSRMSGVSMSNWANYSGLANAGTKAVRDTDPNIIVVVQHGRPREDGGFLPWVDRYMTSNPPIDLDWICGSTYGTTCDGCDWIDQFGSVIDTHNVPVLSCEYTDQRRDLINPIMHDFPNQMGRGTFLWEPSTYQHPLFSRSGNTLTANASMDKYAEIATSYGLPVPSKPASELAGTTCQ